MQKPKIYLGIDSGATKTRVIVLADGQGSQVTKLLADFTVGPGNLHNTSAPELRKLLMAIYARAQKLGRIQAATFGVAGLDSEADFKAYEKILFSTAWSKVPIIRLMHDADILWHGPEQEIPVLVLISGTGSICVGAYKHRRVATGGGGPVIGDQGSGYWIGLQAIKLVARALDGQIALEAWHKKALSHLKVKDLFSLRALAQSLQPENISRVASLASLMEKTALAKKAPDNAEAREILEAAKNHLLVLLATTTKKLALNKDSVAQVIFSGGLLKPEGVLVKHLTADLKQFFPNFIISFPAQNPAYAAALLAFELKK